MSLKSAPYYWLECDKDDCGAKSTEGGEYTAWSDVDGARADADGCDWVTTPDGNDYCDKHASDLDQEAEAE